MTGSRFTVFPVPRLALAAATLALLLPPLPAQDTTPIRRAEPVTEEETEATRIEAPKVEPPVRRAEPVSADPAPPEQGSNIEEQQADAPAAKPAPKPAATAKKPTVPEPEQALFDYATMCYNRKAYDLAITQYSQYLTTYPRGSYGQVALYRLAESHLHLSQVLEAEAIYKQLIQRYKTGDYVANAAYRMASLAFNRRYFDAAAPNFEIASRQTTQDKIRFSSLYYKARCQSELNQAKAAYATYERLAETKKDNPFWDRAVIQMARSDEAAGRTDGALSQYGRLAREGADPELRAEALVKSSRLLKDGGKTDEAIAGFEKVLTLRDEKATPWRAIARFGLIESYYRANEWSKVVESYAATEAVQLPEDQRPRLWLMVGDAQAKLKQHRRAIDLFQMVDQYYPNAPENAEAGYRRLLCLNDLKDPSLPTVAEQIIEKIKSLQPDSEQLDLARFIVAENYFARHVYAQASLAYKAVRDDKIPASLRSPLLFRRGWSSQEAGDHGTAIAAFTNFLEQNPEDPQVPQALAKRGLAYKAAESWKSAQDDFDKIIAEHASSPVAELAYEQSALIKGQRRDTAGMIATFEDMLKKFPETRAKSVALFWIGSGQFDLKKYPQAIEALEQARKLDPKAYERDASLRILLSYYYMSDVPNLVKAVEAERIKENPETRVPRQVYQFLGLKYFELKEMPHADKYLTLASNPGQPDETDYRVWHTLSEARLANSHWEGAVTAADNYLRKGDLPPPQKAKGMLNKARALYALKRYDDATPLINEALRLQPEARVQAHLRLLLGDIAFTQGDPAHAAAIYVVPSQMFDDDEITPLALWKTVQALEKAGKSKEAGEYRSDLEKRFPKFSPPVETTAAATRPGN